MANEKKQQRDENEKPLTVVQMIHEPKMRRQIEAALPKHVTPERIIRVATTALRDPKMAACSQTSVLACVMQSAALGLEINDGLGRAYMLPFRSKGSMVATLIIGYQGMIDLAQRSGRVGRVRAVPVFLGEAFEYEEGLEPRLVHRPKLGGRRDPEALIAVYGTATIALTSEQTFVVVDKNQVEDARKRGASGKGVSTPWDTDYVAMAQKTAIRRLYKWLPKSAEMARAASLEDSVDAGRMQTFDASVFDVTNEAAALAGEPELPPGGATLDEQMDASAPQQQADPVPAASAANAIKATAEAVKRDTRTREQRIAAGEDPDA